MYLSGLQGTSVLRNKKLDLTCMQRSHVCHLGKGIPLDCLNVRIMELFCSSCCTFRGTRTCLQLLCSIKPCVISRVLTRMWYRI